MKRTVKRYLSLLLAIMMLVSSSALSTSAAECNHSTNETSVRVVNPTCTQQGYTEYICTICGEVVSTGIYKDALGHKYGEWEIVKGDEEGTYYVNTQTCGRSYVQKDENGNIIRDEAGNPVTKTCGDTITEMKDGEPVKYYRVDFINNRITAEYDETVKYVNLAKTFTEEKVYETYVKENEAPVYGLDYNPTRGRTKAFSYYICVGWTLDGNLAEPTEDANYDTEDFKALTEYSITENTTFYPVYRGMPYKYGVTFYSKDNSSGEDQLTFTQDVEHGKLPKYHDPSGEVYPNPTRDLDMNNWYEFAGWATSINSDEVVDTETMLATPIYDNLTYYGQFTGHPLNYTIEFRTEDGKNYYKLNNGKDAIFDCVHLGDNVSALLTNNLPEPTKATDKTYMYTFTGKWLALDQNGNPGQEVDLRKLAVPYNSIRYAVDADGNKIYATDAEGNVLYTSTEETDENREQKKVIRLVPKFERRLVRYDVDVEMILPSSEDIDYYRGGAEISKIGRAHV